MGRLVSEEQHTRHYPATPESPTTALPAVSSPAGLHATASAAPATSDAGQPVVDLLVLGGAAQGEFGGRLLQQGVAVRHSWSADTPADAARVAAGAPGETVPLALVDGSVLVSGAPLGALYDDPRLATAALTHTASRTPGNPGPASHAPAAYAPAAQARGTQAPGTQAPGTQAPGTQAPGTQAPATQAPGAQVLGLLRVAPADRATVSRVLAPAPGDGDVILSVVRGLEAAGVRVSAVPLGRFAWARAGTDAERRAAEQLIGGIDERRTRLREAARGGDGFYSTFVLRKLSWHLTGVAERLGVTPNQVTVVSFLIGLLAAATIATGDRPLMVVGAVLLQICLVVDCVDGELARYRRRFSRFGAWLDATTDRVKEFATIAAFAVAGWRNDETLWGLAAAAIALQTFRNLADLGWAAQRGPGREVPPSWIGVVDRLVTPAPVRGPGALEWVRRVGHFPVGERFLVMSIGALVLPPRATLIVLLVCGLLAAAYFVAAFAVRSRNTGSVAVNRVVDGGLLLRPLTVRGRAGALLPAFFVAAELIVTWLFVGGPAGLLLITVVAIAHYQEAYGDREGLVARGWTVSAETRLIVVLLTASTGVGEIAAVVLAAVVAITSTRRSLSAWTEQQS